MIARELANHIGRRVHISTSMPWEDWDMEDEGVLKSVELDPEPNDPRYPMLWIQVSDQVVGVWPDKDINVQFLDEVKA